VAADLVVDAHGRRRSRSSVLWGAAADAEPRRTPCNVVYYSRYYRCRPGFELPDGPWFLSPRGDLGYMAFASFPGDNGTFAAVLAVPPADPQWRPLTDPRVYEAAVATIPSLSGWVDPSGVDPITDVLPMAGLYNVLAPDPAPRPGLVSVGDAYCHTDPTLAHGLAFALIHAAALADAVEMHAEPDDIGAAYRATTRPEVEERFGLASALDDQRARMWRGEPVDAFRHDGHYALFTFAAAAAVARLDPTVFRVFNRRIGLLDRTAVLDDDLALRQLIEQRFAELRATPPPPLGPAKDEMLAVMAEALDR
jgi:2-polyprenyl-6-methoxyphenol hydroxylase-like FAD-dependent oxidoreductase